MTRASISSRREGGSIQRLRKSCQRADFLDQTGGQAGLVLLDGNGHGLAVHVGDDEAPGVGDVNVEPLDADRGFRWGRRIDNDRAIGAVRAGPRGFRDEVLAEEARGVGVVVDPKHQLARGRIDARAAADHLVEADGAFEILEKDDVPHAGHIHPCGQQVHRGGDEVAARGGAQVRELVVAAAGGGALEGVILQPLLAVLGAPVGIEVVHGRRPHRRRGGRGRRR